MAKNVKPQKLLTKVAKGVAFGDTSNSAIRNILTEISRELYGKLDDIKMCEAMEFFCWRCPYTGIDLKPLIDKNLGGYATDHIYPQNKEWCGLNVQGNLILVDKEANAAKRDLDIETFLNTDTKVLKDIDEIGRTRQKRLDDIRAFQAKFGYDPELIRKVVKPMMEERYKLVREEQENWIRDVLLKLEEEGIKPPEGLNTKETDAENGHVKNSAKGYTYDEKLKVAVYYLQHNEGLEQVEENCMHLTGRNGATAKNILNQLGIDTSKETLHKGLLLEKNIDDEILKATGTFKLTLEAINKSKLVF